MTTRLYRQLCDRSRLVPHVHHAPPSPSHLLTIYPFHQIHLQTTLSRPTRNHSRSLNSALISLMQRKLHLRVSRPHPCIPFLHKEGVFFPLFCSRRPILLQRRLTSWPHLFIFWGGEVPALLSCFWCRGRQDPPPLSCNNNLNA